MSHVDTDGRGPQAAADQPRAGGEDGAPAAEELAGKVSAWVARAVSRAREETEDVWAEAQELRRRW